MTAARVTSERTARPSGRRSLSARLAALPRISPITAATLAGLAALHTAAVFLFLGASASGDGAWFSRLPLDEVWARLVYVRSFADSFTFEFNPGEMEAGATSPLWVALLGLIARIFGASDDALPGLAKALSMGFGTLCCWMAFKVTWQVTGKWAVALLTGAVVAVEPHFAFAAASSMEVTLFAALALAASWAYLRGRVRTAGVLAALTVSARPEGILLAALVLGATLARWIWRREGALLQRREDVQEMAWLGLPPLLVIAVGITYNWSVNGTPLPGTYLARHEELGLAPLPNIWNVWLGYFHELPFMDGLAWLVALPVITLGGVALLRRHRFSAAPLALFTLALAYAASVTFTRPSEEWGFADRRHMDAAVPFIAVLFAAGLVWSWQLIRRWHRAQKPRSERERRALLITAHLIAGALVIIPLVSLPVEWSELTAEYSWDSQDVSAVNVAMGRWLAENTPEDVVIGAAPAGAARFLSHRVVLDLDGAHTHDALRSTPLEFAAERQVDYIVAFQSPYFDSVPGRPVAHEEVAAFNSSLPSNVMRAYGPPGGEGDAVVLRSSLVLFDASGLAVMDTVDVANLSAPAAISEATHDYGLEGAASSVKRTARTAEGVSVEDDARVFSAAEELTVTSIPGQPLTVVKRYDAAVGGRLRVFADGVEVGVWELPRGEFFFGEAAFTILGETVTQNRTRLRFEVIPTQAALAGNSYFYWILAPEAAVPLEMRPDRSVPLDPNH
jgi:hypothetical protein